MKLTKNKIKIMSEGQQVKNIILQKYDSLEEFIEKNGLTVSLDTVRNYTRKKVITSEAFKDNLEEIFQRDYYQMVFDEARQIESYVNSISENIELYKSDEDIETLEELRDLCLKTKAALPLVKMYRAIAMYNFYRNNADVAAEVMKLALNNLEAGSDDNLFLLCSSDLALIYFYDVKYNKAKEIFDSIMPMLQKTQNIERKIAFLCYYRLGILQNNTSNQELARKSFQKSLEYIDDRFHTSRAIMNIGLTYKKEKNFDEALKYYDKALEIVAADDSASRSFIFNNIAEVYRVLGDYDTALKYVEQAFVGLENSNPLERFVAFYTYCEIKAAKGEIKKTMDKLIELLSDIHDKFLYRKFIVEGINIILTLGKTHEGSYVFDKIEDTIIKLIKESPELEEDYRKSLLLCLGQIKLYNIENRQQA